MTKRTTFTTITPLPAGISRQTALDFLHDHVEMIDLNPLIIERHLIVAPDDCPPEERNCIWYSLTDKISYLPGGLATSAVSYTCAFHDLPTGLQTHCYAPLGLDIRDRWSVGGSLPGEPSQPVELGIGAPSSGLYLREDVDMRCSIVMAAFVKKNIKKSHGVLVETLAAKARAKDAAAPPAVSSAASFAPSSDASSSYASSAFTADRREEQKAFHSHTPSSSAWSTHSQRTEDGSVPPLFYQQQQQQQQQNQQHYHQQNNYNNSSNHGNSNGLPPSSNAVEMDAGGYQQYGKPQQSAFVSELE